MINDHLNYYVLFFYNLIEINCYSGLYFEVETQTNNFILQEYKTYRGRATITPVALSLLFK